MTFSDLTYFVDPTGNDSNACTTSGVNACLTIQGAINKSPKQLMNRVTINVAAGNYAGFLVAGFVQDNSIQSVTGGLLIQGTLVNSTNLISGTATGIATSGTPASGSTWGTLTDATQNWTINDLRGRFLAITSGTGASTLLFKVISSNTATMITTIGTGFTPDATSHYAIQDAASIITSGIHTLPQAQTNGSGTGASIIFESNKVAKLGGITVTAFGITNPVIQGGVAAVSLENNAGTATLQNIQNNAGSPTHYVITGAGQELQLLRSYSVYDTHQHDDRSHVIMQSGAARFTSISSMFEQGEYALSGNNANGAATFTNSETHDTERGISPFGPIDLIVSNSRIGCDGQTSEWGLEVGEHHDGNTANGYVDVSITDFNNCSIMIMQGGGNLQVSSITGIASSAVIENVGSGHAVFTNGGLAASSDAGTDILLGLTLEPFRFSDIAVPGCAMSLIDSSSVCKN